MSATFNGEVHPAADMFRLLEGDELQELADDISERGLRVPIVLLPDGTLLDGRNRLAACRIAGVAPKFSYFLGESPVSEVVSLNVKQRHMSLSERSLLAVDMLPQFEEEAKDRMAAAGAASAPGRGKGSPIGEPFDSPKRKHLASDDAAKATNASARAVQRAKRIIKDAPDLAEKIRNGEMALDRADRIIRDRASEKRKVEKAKLEALALNITSTVDIRHGDFREALADLRDVDAIITDPPYPREYLPLLDDLAAWSDKVLKPDGVMVVLFGQTYLPEVYRRLEGGRTYRWTARYETPGGGYVSHKARCHSNWKPLLIYGGGPRFGDTFSAKSGDAGAKHLHEWGQDYGAFHDIVQTFTQPGDTIADPFMGAGTTLLAAHAQGRNTIGADIELAHVQTTRERLK